MESLREIKTRKIATQKTAQITSAMNMVSTSKLRRAEKQYKEYIDYLNRIMDCIRSIAGHLEEKDDLIHGREVNKVIYLIITSDRGLAGSYNSNIYKAINEEVKNIKTDYIIASIGKKGYGYCKNKGYNMMEDGLVYVRDEVEFHEIQGLAHEIILKYLNKEVDKVVVCYNKYINTLKQEVKFETLLPLGEKNVVSQGRINYEFEGTHVLRRLIPMYIENVIYGIIIDAKASEHASRMTAMKTATDNANELIYKLQLLYNRARQQAITNDIIDIVSGANAV